MSNVTLIRSRIARKLDELFQDKIYIDDLKGRTEEDKRSAFLSRALGALFLHAEAKIGTLEAAACVCDDFTDGGIDALYVDEKNKKIYIIQSKWRTGAKGITLSDFTRTRDGVNKLVNLSWDAENKSTYKYKEKIERALSDIDTTIVFVLAHNIDSTIAPNIKSKIDDYVKMMNRHSDMMEFREYGLSDIVRAARHSTRQSNIDLQLLMRGWAIHDRPYVAVYGVVSGDDVAGWYKEHSTSLFSENVRFLLEKSDVNEAISETVRAAPEHFWYFNNGITAICESFKKAPLGGDKNDTGVFQVSKMSIINGAQTVGTLGRCLEAGADVSKISLHMRIISLEGTEDNFANDVTRSNNTQNDLMPIDFVSLDENQGRLRREAATLGTVYSYRRGDAEPDPGKGFTIRDATIAAACASGDLKLAVAAKRYISGLWGDIKKEPYTRLFNTYASAVFLWNIVQVMREVDRILSQEANALQGRERLVAVHGNRFILFMVFSKINLSDLRKKSWRLKSHSEEIGKHVKSLLCKVLVAVTQLFPDNSYPGNIFKNQDRQYELQQEITR
jgi:hypothetical protein